MAIVHFSNAMCPGRGQPLAIALSYYARFKGERGGAKHQLNSRRPSNFVDLRSLSARGRVL
jgi:hypothetical protein